MKLSPSAVLKYEECPRAYRFSYIEGWQQEFTPANLAFGTAMHQSIEHYQLELAKGNVTQPAAFFPPAWAEAIKGGVDFGVPSPHTFAQSDYEEVGPLLLDKYAQAWATAGITVATDDQGPMIERYMRFEAAPGVELALKIDFVGIDANGDTVVIDWKTPAQPSSPQFLAQSEQLTYYADATRRALALQQLPKVGFFELVKRKVPKARGSGPFIAPLTLVGRTEAEVTEAREKLVWMAEDITRGRFPRRPYMAFSSPCTRCEFFALCYQGDHEGLVKKQHKDSHKDQIFAPLAKTA